MKIAYLSQRETIDNYGENVDSLETRYVDFFEKMGYKVVPLSNHSSFLDLNVDDSIIVLTGGGKIPNQFYDKNYNYSQQPNRNSLEITLIEKAIKDNIPLIGICHGMQFIAGYFGSVIRNLSELDMARRAGSTHNIIYHNKYFVVNHFHDDGLLVKDSKFNNLAVDADYDIVEAFEYKNFLGLQWHPERNSQYVDIGISLISNFIKRCSK